MATEYRVNIQLNTDKVRKDLKDIKTDIDKLGRVNLGTNQRTQRTEAQITKSKLAQRVAMAETRRVGDLVQKAADQGLKVARAREAVDKSALLNSKKEFKESKAILKLALDELKIQRSISKEKAQQAALAAKTASNNAKAMAGGPFISTGIASSRFGSVGQPGSPRFIASRAGRVQGPADPPYAPGMFPSSPIGGSKFMFGSPAQVAFAGSGMGRSSLRGNRFQFKSPAFFEAGARAGGARSPLLGTRFDFGSPAQLAFSGTGMGRSPVGGRADLVGSLPNLNRVARENAMPVKGFEFLVGSPKYYEKVNKDILKIAKSKGNVLPVGGMKHLVGSPAYLEDQAKQLKKLRGAPTGFSAAQFGPQQSLSTLQGPRMFGQAGPAFDLTGQSSPLNFDSRGNLLPGRMGSRQTKAALMRTLSRNRSAAFQSAAISGAFPLLFGQGPLAAAGGAIGGGLGGVFGGQMGGFAGGLIGTAVVSGVQNFITKIQELGSALDPVSGNATQAIQALGFIGTARAREIALIEKTIGSGAALNEVRKELIDTVGAKKTLALEESAKTIKNAQNSIAETFTKFKANMAGLAADLTSGKITTLSLMERGAAANPDLGISKQFQLNKQQTDAIQLRGVEALQAGFAAPTGFLGSGTPRLTKKGRDRLKELKAEKESITLQLRSLGIQDKVNELVKGTNITFTEQLQIKRSAFGLESEILKLRSQGINPAIAKEMAMLKKVNDDNVIKLQSALDLRKETLKTIKDEEKKAILQEEIDGLEKGLKLLKDQNSERIDAVRKTMELNMRTELVVSSAEKLKQTLVTDLGNGIKELIRGTSTLNDVMRNVLDKMIDAAFNMALFGNAGGSFMPGLGLLGSIFKANGGPVKGGGSYVVGERGPELFTPGVSGMITPNHALGGSTNVVVNVDASGSSVEGDEQQGRELGRVISAAVQSELIQQKRPGGLLA